MQLDWREPKERGITIHAIHKISVDVGVSNIKQVPIEISDSRARSLITMARADLYRLMASQIAESENCYIYSALTNPLAEVIFRSCTKAVMISKAWRLQIPGSIG